ncbi:MAG: hypothetical protein IPJ88_11260 [Myxococcales bacterium]|nr:MAG: hypothetical protein IPJ88_11260 [Myxococcales bacterium]
MEHVNQRGPLAAPQPKQPSFEPYSRYADLERWLFTYLVEKAPSFPFPELKEKLPTYMAWINAIGLAIFFPIYLVASLVRTLFAPLTFLSGFTSAAMYIAHMALSACAVYCSIRAISGLFKKTRSGWTWLLYSELFNVLSMAIGL